jgi:hypothetical protein
MKKKTPIVTVKLHGEFNEDHRKFVEHNLRKEAFPQFYSKTVFKSLVHKGVMIIPAELINRDALGSGSSQSIRVEGKNDAYDELHSDITENGFRLYEKPIAVRRIGNTGRFELLDGRTKDKILNEMKFKNRICNVFEMDDLDAEDFGRRMNAGEDNPPAGLLKEVDVIKAAYKLIESGLLELDSEVILGWINKCCGKGKFGAKKRSDLAHLIFNRKIALQTFGLLPIAWSSNKEVYSWLEMKKYVETSTVVYVPYAASSPMKAVFRAAREAQQKPGKEIRVVVYVSKLNGYDLQKCYLDAVLKFKAAWYEYMDLFSNTYYDGAPSNSFKVKLYGCVPSQIQGVCEDMEKLIVFGKNDDKINSDFLADKGLMASLISNDEELDEELEEETE